MVIAAIASHKGGVGKSAATHALIAILSARQRVLLVNVELQDNLSRATGLPEDVSPTLVDVLNGQVEAARAVNH